MEPNQGRPLSSLRRLVREVRIEGGLRPKSYLGGTRTINGVVYQFHPTKGYRKERSVYGGKTT